MYGCLVAHQSRDHRLGPLYARSSVTRKHHCSYGLWRYLSIIWFCLCCVIQATADSESRWRRFYFVSGMTAQCESVFKCRHLLLYSLTELVPLVCWCVLIGNSLCPGDHIPWRRSLDNSDSRIQHMLMSNDAQLEPIVTPFGTVNFVQVN